MILMSPQSTRGLALLCGPGWIDYPPIGHTQNRGTRPEGFRLD